MKIDPTSHLRAARISESRPDKSATSQEPEDRSSLSALAHHLKAPDAREQRIEALRAAVENGTYKVSSADLAASLIEAHSTRHQ